MRILLLLLLPVLSLGQTKLDTITLLSNKVKILAPKELTSMSDKMWEAKYQKKTRPLLVLSDADGEVNLIANTTQLSSSDKQIASFKNFQLQNLKKTRPDLSVIDEGVKTINGRMVGYIKFMTLAIDQKVFNYYFFTSVEGKILFFTFNCIEKLQPKWESTADAIVSSIKIM